jgi:prepilin-type N-terminal cleavage/methylation domain-containing protein
VIFQGTTGDRSARCGMTLLELMLVMGLAAVIMGIGAGMLSSIDTSDRVAASSIRSALRAARNSSVTHTGTARVRIDAKAGTLVAEGLEVVGTWRFEDVLWKGAFGLDGVPVNGDPACVPGFLGNCVSFVGQERGTHLGFDLSEEPRFHLEQGFAYEVMVNLESLTSSHILNIGKVAGLDLRNDGGLVTWFMRGSADEFTRVDRGIRVSLESGGGMVRAGAWNRIRVEYDQRLLTIAVNGVEVARQSVEGPVIDMNGPLLVGDGSPVLDGRVDDLVIWAVTEAMTVQLPENAVFGKDVPGVVRFAAGGALDPTVHREPVSIHLEYEDQTEQAIHVGLFGTVE